MPDDKLEHAPLAYYCSWNGTFHRRSEITAEQAASFTPLYEWPAPLPETGPSTKEPEIGPHGFDATDCATFYDGCNCPPVAAPALPFNLKASDERVQRAMQAVGMPQSISLFTALKQMENEIRHELASAQSAKVALDDVTVEFDPRNNFCFKNGSKWIAVDDVQRLIAEAKQFAVSTIQPRPEPEPHSYALLKLEGAERPLFFVMEERYGSRAEEDYEDSRRFFYEEHSCPTNWLGNCVAVIEDGDADPHGFLSFVRSVPIKQDAEKDHNGEEDWLSIFPEAFVSATGTPSK